MTIDVLLPTYNRRAFLPRAIECIRNQTFPEWRLLIVNDGGEDVEDIVREIRDPRIVYFNRPHLGKAAQLNFALTQVAAPYVAYMDDDDDVFPDHFEKLMDAVQRTGADFVYSDTYLTILDPQGKVVSRTIENTLDAPYDEIRLFNRINHKQILHETALARQIGGYDEQMRILIDFDGIKRLVGAAKRPFHLREITGEHFLRMDAKTGTVSSISGLWKKDPEAAGRSLLKFFEKDPAALARLYRSIPVYEKTIAEQKEKLARRWSARFRAFFKRKRFPEPGVFTDALPTPGAWQEATPQGGVKAFFTFADETHPAIAAVNRIAEGVRDEKTRAAAFEGGGRFEIGEPRFEYEETSEGVHFVAPAGTPRRWILLSSRTTLPKNFAFSFDYIPHTVFKEQLQFDWAMRSLGDRLRFLVRENRVLAANAVENGRFPADGRRAAFAFPLDRPTSVRIEVRDGVMTFSADGRSVLSLRYEGPAGRAGDEAAFLFYAEDVEQTIDFEIRNFRYFTAL